MIHLYVVDAVHTFESQDGLPCPFLCVLTPSCLHFNQPLQGSGGTRGFSARSEGRALGADAGLGLDSIEKPVEFTTSGTRGPASLSQYWTGSGTWTFWAGLVTTLILIGLLLQGFTCLL